MTVFLIYVSIDISYIVFIFCILTLQSIEWEFRIKIINKHNQIPWSTIGFMYELLKACMAISR